MPGLLELCENYFGSKDLYEVLQIDKSASEKEVRKAYRKLSLVVHPDRVEEIKKEEATEKFKVLGKIHSILSNPEQKEAYDETGTISDESDEMTVDDWGDYWRKLFKKITVQDINNYEKQYKGSEEELNDLKRAYLNGKGDMDFILEAVPFTHTEEEPRLKELIQNMIEAGDVPEYRAFSKETPSKRDRRKRKWAKEAEEAAKLSEQVGFSLDNDDANLAALIKSRHSQRGAEMSNLFEALEEKYCQKKSSKGAKATKRKPGTKKK